jgi:excinuclease ABC subunit B
MYADKITKSMQATLDETEYRRAKQIQYNEEHGKVPEALIKKSLKIWSEEAKISLMKNIHKKKFYKKLLKQKLLYL